MVVSSLIVCKDEHDTVLDLKELIAFGKIRLTNAIRMHVGSVKTDTLLWEHKGERVLFY